MQDIDWHKGNLEYTVSPIYVTDVFGSGIDLPSSAMSDIVGTKTTFKLESFKMDYVCIHIK